MNRPIPGGGPTAEGHLYRRPPKPVRIRYRAVARNKILVYKLDREWRVEWRGRWRSSRVHEAELPTYAQALGLVNYLLNHTFL